MKILPVLLTTATFLTAADAMPPEGWKMVWKDEFDGANRIDTKKWTPCERGAADWNDTMTNDPRCYSVSGGRLQLRGIVDRKSRAKEPVYLTGGLTTKGKFQIQHGRVEIRCRLRNARGAWPALWLLGVDGGWPRNGEIDIMEHLNSDAFIYQTVHSQYTGKIDKTNTPPKSSTARADPQEFNIYGVRWDKEKVEFLLNGKTTFTYPRVPEKGADQWPFDQPFYLIMSMQIGGTWVGKPDPQDYPSGMEIDWVRIYTKAP